MEAPKTDSLPADASQEKQQQQDATAVLRQRAAARQERLLARQAQRMRIVQGIDTAAASSISTGEQSNRNEPQERAGVDAGRGVPKSAAQINVADTSSKSISRSTTRNMGTWLDLFCAFVGVGAAVNTILQEEASPYYLFEALGFPYGPTSWTVLCAICSALLYLPLPLLLLLSVSGQLQQQRGSPGDIWRGTAKLFASPVAPSHGSQRPWLLRAVIAAPKAAAAVKPHLLRFSFFFVSFCFVTTTLRIAAWAAGCCQRTQRQQ
ncbi:hypothetical protein, conserved [Eimeria tenella]|uniref:Uncharacterized protein n=1 Tax=Eimeria tenella TaxID=5802 RepID=U6KU62_EIMTE|nr:hypothetical protein, conserved [Eimeria tenella]CDJ41697.1 hypothetical protein, conserved [Eimeria tenella]|eukprot:XP_013232447.1 hypothetical protein, conserved [Eimeria tenella]